ncbi:carbohydrate ABC transporter permease [Cohnella sp. 56]|uniref:carbohydrate ABC transporter permease n=1 Tax=Cohnella sp. 56 TaxID=3113722 RepID=UPI0030EA99AA
MLNSNRISRIWPVLVVLPALFLYILFVLLPTLSNLFLSFTDFTGNLHKPLHYIGINNYSRAFHSDFQSIGGAIRNTLIFSVLVTLVQNMAAVLLAVLVNLKLKLRNIYRAILFMPNVLGVVIIGLVWTLIFDPISGPIVKGFERMGIDTALLGDPGWALYLVVFVTIWANLGYAMVIYIAGLQSIPEEMYEAARIDGATTTDTFMKITLPLLQPAITINILISLIGTLSTYDFIMVLTNGGPGTATMTLSLFVFKNLYNGESQGYLAALSMIQFAFIFIIVVVVQHFLRKREAEL